MKLAVPKESHPQETRVAISPETAKKFRGLNLEVVIEWGAGASAGFTDEAYDAAGVCGLQTAARRCSPVPIWC